MDRILYIGDSLAFPRKNHGQEFEDTYPFMLTDSLSTTPVFRNIGNSNSKDTYNQIHIIHQYCGTTKFKSCIVQTGIVDCSPRPAPLYIMNKFSKLVPLISKMREHRPWRAVEDFRDDIGRIISHGSRLASSTIIVGIGPAGESLIQKLPTVQKWIDQYNELLLSIATERECLFCDISDFSPESHMLQDGFHLSREGHVELSGRLRVMIQEV